MRVVYGEALVTVEDGAVIEVGNKHLFTVAAASISANTLVSIEITRLEVDGNVDVIYDFGPDGLAFSLPAVLQVDVKKLFDKFTTSVNFYYLNEQTNLWEAQGTVPVDIDGYAYVPVYHFSKYGVSR